MPVTPFAPFARAACMPAAALLLLLGLVEAAPAGAAAPPSAAPAPAPAPDPRPVPYDSLVPGIPVPSGNPHSRDTPDQGAYPPLSEAERRESATKRNPGAEQVDPGPGVEYVPPGEARTGKEEDEQLVCSDSTGPYQAKVEEYLRLPVDGRQSPADCDAIQKFQQKENIQPANGFAGPVTFRASYASFAAHHPGRLLADRHCPSTGRRVACLDLTNQIMWVREGSRVVYPAVPIRTGMRGYATRTGTFSVQRRIRDEWSRLYHQPMPFSQYFSGGQAMHGTYKNIYSPPGSYGCVNLRYGDAERLWSMLRIGSGVRIWGSKPRA
ncbi:L,D-transpeptidase family protein [Streptomyces axinellae]